MNAEINRETFQKLNGFLIVSLSAKILVPNSTAARQKQKNLKLIEVVPKCVEVRIGFCAYYCRLGQELTW